MLTAVYIYIFYVLICVNAQTFISCDMSIEFICLNHHERRKLIPDYDEGSLEANGLHSDPKVQSIIISQESKVISIIRHRGEPRRSLGNYKKKPHSCPVIFEVHLYALLLLIELPTLFYPETKSHMKYLKSII